MAHSKSSGSETTLPPLVAGIGRSAYRTVAGSRHLHEQIFQELIDNALDSPVSASRVWITIRPDGTAVVTDDGAGANARRRDAMISLFDSPDAGTSGKKGMFGTGLKAAFLLYGRVRVFTKTTDEPFIWEFSFSPEEAYSSLTQGTSLPDYKRHPAGHKVPFFLDPETGRTKTSGTILVLEEPIKGRKVNAERLLTRLPECLLLPSVIRRVTVDGKPLQLDKNAIPFCGTPEDGILLASGGRIYCEFGLIPSDSSRRRRIKSIGARGHICTWEEMVDAAPDIGRVISRFPEEFGNPSLWFQIDCDAWTMHAGENARNFLNSAFYTDPSVDEVLSYIESEFGRLIREKVRGVTDGQKADYTPLADDVMDTLREHLDEGPAVPVPPTVPLWRIAPSRIKMACGAQTSFAIVEREEEPDATYEWADIDAGGSVEPRTGKDVLYTARALPGGFVIEVMRRKPGEEPQTRQAYLTLIEHQDLAISPEECTLEPGERRTFTLVNTDGLSGVFHWDDTHAGGILTVKKDGFEGLLRAGDTEGNFRLLVQDGKAKIGRDGKNAAGRLARVAASIVIARPKQRVERDPSRNTVKVEGCQFRVTVQALKPDQFAIFSNKTGTDLWTIVVNVRQPALAKAERDGQLRDRILWLVAGEIAAKVAETVDDAGFTLDGYRAWLSRILARLAAPTK
ncbi:ATP-binding protein [Candidatus Uhrbacteria bacterium]|nr:ATP-binding protein [Candidatus Uhrbacteria bacterium]